MSVLIIGYRRKNEIIQVIKSVSKIKPRNLYLAMDGPKDEQSKSLCDGARAGAMEAVNWDCNLHTKFNEKNIGIDFISLSIDWFFKHEDEGLILEDDVLIHPDFINFAKNFIYSKNICCVSACTFEDELDSNIENISYCFSSNIPSIWGWYSTKEIWEEFRNFKRRKANPLKYFINFYKKIGFWQSFVFSMCLKYTDRGKLAQWDYEFAYFAACKDKRAVFPGICMAQNIGNSHLAENCSSTSADLSPKINIKNINYKKLNKRPFLNNLYMNKQSMNILMKNEYKIQAFKGLINYFLPQKIKKILKKLLNLVKI